MAWAELTPFLPYMVAFAVTLIMIRALEPVADRIGLVDCPDSRKNHEGRIPLVGGMAMFCGFAFAALTVDVALGAKRAALAGVLVLIISGVLDDFRELSARSRFAAQIVSGLLLVVWGDVVLRDLGYLLVPDERLVLYLGAVPLTIFALVGGVNALNMADGMDGLAGGLALIALAAALWFAWQAGATALMPFIGIAVACTLAFWLVNMRFPWRRQARVFMGDSGSTFLGFLIAWFLTAISQAPIRAMPPVIALYLFAIPLMDTIFVMTRRMIHARSPFAADRLHLHHLMTDLGFSPGQAVSLILVSAASLAALGVIAAELAVPDFVLFYVFIALFASYYAGCSHLRRRIKQTRL